jgi:uncharacterized membrane protein
MFTRLRQPGGVLGGLSLTAALFLGVLGVLGVVSLLIAAVAGTEFWSDQRDEQLISAVLFAVIGAEPWGSSSWISDLGWGRQSPSSAAS